jgi:glycosyltransferase involved in cell wall biosynthesis
MIIGIDVSPLYTGHKIRGIGFYVKRLMESLRKLGLKELVIKELENDEDVKRQDYDLLHIPYFNPYFLTIPWPWEISKPLVVTIHDLIPVKYPNHYPPGMKAKIRWQIQKILLRQTKLVITDSFSSKYDINNLTGYPLDRIYVVYLAAGENFKELKDGNWKIEIRDKYNLPHKFCLYVGDVNWNKNIPGLVEACQKIHLPLVIVGKQAVNKNYDKNHPENKDLVWLQKKNSKFQCSQPLTESVVKNKFCLELTGFVSDDDLIALYNLATVYCQPSFDEGFGLPVLEAMACGCPVVCSNQGSLPEIAGEAAIFVKPTVNKLAKAIKNVTNSEKLQAELSQKGLVRIQHFSWNKTARETVKIYKMAIEMTK